MNNHCVQFYILLKKHTKKVHLCFWTWYRTQPSGHSSIVQNFMFLSSKHFILVFHQSIRHSSNTLPKYQTLPQMSHLFMLMDLYEHFFNICSPLTKAITPFLVQFNLFILEKSQRSCYDQIKFTMRTDSSFKWPLTTQK